MWRVRLTVLCLFVVFASLEAKKKKAKPKPLVAKDTGLDFRSAPSQCSACACVLAELGDAVTEEKPQMGYTASRSNSARKEMDYRMSELRAIELLEGLCPRMLNYYAVVNETRDAGEVRASPKPLRPIAHARTIAKCPHSSDGGALLSASLAFTDSFPSSHTNSGSFARRVVVAAAPDACARDHDARDDVYEALAGRERCLAAVAPVAPDRARAARRAALHEQRQRRADGRDARGEEAERTGQRCGVAGRGSERSEP